jgi:hypothetical protein
MGKGKKSPVDQSLAEHMKLRDSEKRSEARLRRVQVGSLGSRRLSSVLRREASMDEQGLSRLPR